MRAIASRIVARNSSACVSHTVCAAPGGIRSANCRVGQLGRMSSEPLMKVAGISMSAIRRNRVGRLMYSFQDRPAFLVHLLVGGEDDTAEVFADGVEFPVTSLAPRAVVHEATARDAE